MAEAQKQYPFLGEGNRQDLVEWCRGEASQSLLGCVQSKSSRNRYTTHVQKSMLPACWELRRIAFVRQIHERLVCIQHGVREEVGIIARAVGGNKYVYVRAAYLCKNTSLCSYLSTLFLFHFPPFLTFTSMLCTLYLTSNSSLVYLRLMPYSCASILLRTAFLLS